MASFTGAVRRLQGQIDALRGGLTGTGSTLPVAIELGPSPSTSRPNGVASLLLAKPDHTYPDTSAITIKREDTTWGAASPYGSGQPLLLLSPSTQPANDLSGDGIAGSNNNSVLARLDPYGGLGLANGLHIAPGLRNTYGGPGGVGAWVQKFIDTYSYVSSNPDPGVVPNPLQPHYLAMSFTGVSQWSVNSQGQAVTYADDGLTPVTSMNPGDAGNSGYRTALRTMNAATGGIGLRTAPSQVGDAFTVFDSAGTTPLGGLGRDGRPQVYGDDGVTIVGAIFPGDLGNSGARAILLTKNKNTIGVAFKLASGQVGDVIQTVDSSNVTRTIVDGNSRLRATLAYSHATAPASTATVDSWISVFDASTSTFKRVAAFL